MKLWSVAAMVLAVAALSAWAAPTTADAHGAKSKRYYGNAYRTYRPRRYYRRDRRAYRRGYYRGYQRSDWCSVQPLPHYQDYPYWAACAFTPRGVR